jgi:hypothetical protein
MANIAANILIVFILTLVLSENVFGAKQKTITPPFKLNGRSLNCLSTRYIVISMAHKWPFNETIRAPFALI